MICDSFKRLETDTWELLRRCVAHNHQLGEETITDINLLNIKEWEPTIITHEFTRRAERKSGGDWEWWFTDNTGRWLGIRIQAKIINLATNSFHHLSYPITLVTKRNGREISRRNTSQTEILIESSRNEPRPTYPLYCLYCYWDNADIQITESCSRLHLGDDRYFGCSIIDAHKVLELNRDGLNTLDVVSPFLRPLHCLVCCPGLKGFGGSQLDVIDLFLKQILNREDEDAEDFDAREGFDNMIHDSPPDYVNMIWKNKNITKENIYIKDKRLSSLVIYDLNKLNG